MKLLVTLLALLFSPLVIGDSLPINEIKQIVVLGDSLSDNGNLYEIMQHQIPVSPPYYEGRFSNGPVWIEHLVASYFPKDSKKYLEDYAFGGAGILEDADDDVLFTLNHEIEVYLLAHQGVASPDSLFIVWIGANNYLSVPNDVEKTVQDVNTGILHGLQRLVSKGARHIMVLNLPDLGRTPLAREYNAETQLSELSTRHNQALKQTIKNLKKNYPYVQWIYFDTHQAIDELLNAPEKYGFTNVMDTCYDINVNELSHQSILKMAAKTRFSLRADACEGFLFFDSVHSTVLGHQIIAKKVREYLDKLGLGIAGE